jgi:hypothetical protein
MTRWKRILVNLLLPAPIGLVYTFGIIWLSLASRGTLGPISLPTRQSVLEGLAILAVAYLFAILPSILFTVAMEWLYRKKSVAPSSGKALLYSTIGGTVSGAVISMPMYEGDKITLIMYPIAGGLTGLTLGTLIKLAETRAGHARRSSPTRIS